MSLVVVNATGPTTTTLPLISSLPGRTITIKDSGSASGTNTVTIQTTAGNTFETGVASYILNTPLAFITFLGNPTTLKWRVIATTYADVPITISTVTQATGTLGGAAGTLTTLSVSGLTTLGNSSNTGNLGVAGTTTLNSVSATNINFSGTLSSNGTTFSGAPAGINSAGSVGIGAAAGATTLLVTGTQSNTGTLGVAGATTLASVGIGGAASGSATLLVTGNQSNTGSIFVAGSISATRYTASGGNMTARTGGVYNRGNDAESSSYQSINWVPGDYNSGSGWNTFDTTSQGAAGVFCSAKTGLGKIDFFVKNNPTGSNSPDFVGGFTSSGLTVPGTTFTNVLQTTGGGWGFTDASGGIRMRFAANAETQFYCPTTFEFNTGTSTYMMKMTSNTTTNENKSPYWLAVGSNHPATCAFDVHGSARFFVNPGNDNRTLAIHVNAAPGVYTDDTNDGDTVIRAEGTSLGICLSASGSRNNLRVSSTGSIVRGSFSVTGSKNFSIDHPILSNCKLIHGSIEGPRYDLIYRNRKQLVNGSVEVDLEKESTSNGATMTAGTFDALAANPQVFLQNNDTFDRVKGYVSSHMLFIECENTNSSAFIDWMVTAERHDPGIVNDSMTDKNGFLVPEQYISTISTIGVSTMNASTEE